MSEAHKKIDLDAALAAWPEVKDASDARVRSILAKLDAGTSSPSDDVLFAAPFAEEPDERQRDRESFRAIARLAPSLTPSAPVVLAAKELDSGIVDLGAASAADPGAEDRARTTPLARDDLFEETPRSRHPISMGPMPSSVPSIPIVALSSHRLVDDLSPPSTRSHAEPPKRGVPLYLAGGVAMFAAAAAFFLLMKAPASTSAPTANVTTTQVPSPPSPQASAPEPAVTATAEPPATVAITTPAPSPPPPAAKPAIVAARPKSRAIEPSAAATEAAQPPEDAAPLQVPAAGTVGAAGTGDVPQRPSQGAISSAFGPVMTEARACLGSEDAPVRASVVFAGDGTVQSVTLAPSGTADPCIKAALRKAKVTPFAEGTFTASTNVRHN